jgi:hypothetical protein
MLARKRTAWQRLGTFAPVLLLVMALPSQIMLRCRADGRLRSSCCCPSARESGPLGSFPSLVAQACCERQVLPRDRPAVGSIESRPRELGSPIGPVSLLPPIIFAAPEQKSRPAWQRHGPPREGPALILLKHAFLI